jgi:hypothetical protein
MAHFGSVMSESTDSRNPSIFLLWRTVFELGKENPSERDFICLISEAVNPSESDLTLFLPPSSQPHNRPNVLGQFGRTRIESHFR